MKRNIHLEIYPCLQGFYSSPKAYIFSKLMSYQLLEGETDFAIEANYISFLAIA